MKKVYTHDNKALVDLAFNLLSDNGIKVVLQNEFGSAGMAPPYNINEEVWVLDDEDFEKACELLASMNIQDEAGSSDND